MLRVLFVDHVATLSGGEIALYNLVRSLNPKMVTPIVVLFSNGPLVRRLKDAGIETHVVPLAPHVVSIRKASLGPKSLLRLKDILSALAFTLRLAGFIRTIHVDIVHTNSLKADLLGGLAARLAGRPVIWHVRDRIAADYLPPMVVRLFRWLCQWAPHYIIANSQATMDTVKSRVQSRVVPSGAVIGAETHPGSSTALRVVYDGFDQRDYERSRAIEIETHQTPLVGLVGRISPWKGQHIFLYAARQVLDRYPRARFQIVGAPLFGEDAYEVDVQTLARSLGIDHRVEFTGFRPDVLSLIRRMDVLVHASTTGEPFGQVVIEGMAAGKPIVATDGGGIPEIVVDGATGLLVPMGDPDAMATAILRLLADPVEAARMGQRGRQRVFQHFTIEQTARRVEQIYATLLGIEA